MPSIDWSDAAAREDYENDLKAHREVKRNYSWSQWLIWFFGIILIPALLVICFYGAVAYAIINGALEEKKVKEEIMRQEWEELRQANFTVDLGKINFEYSNPMNTLLRHYIFLTGPCQGLAFLSSVAFHYTNYRLWNLLGTIGSLLCLPVDMLIFYVEPLGFVGTLVAMVMGFIPFAITIADAVYPEKEVNVIGLQGEIFTVHKNSWTKHLSLSYNERYNLVLRMTAAGYSFFATVALVITLLRGIMFTCIIHCVEVKFLILCKS